MKSHDQLVSIVVTTKDSERSLADCLRSICLQSYSSIELIVVDNFSSDSSLKVAQQFTSKVVSAGPERSRQRNVGLLQWAAGSIFGYIDSDMILGPEVVQQVVQAVRSGAVSVYVPEIVLAKGIFGRARRFEREAYDGTSIDAVRFFTSEAFRKVGGFDETSFGPGPEDWDLDIRLRTRGHAAVLSRVASSTALGSWPLKETCIEKGMSPSVACAIYHDETEIGWRQQAQKKTRYAKSLPAYVRKWGRRQEDVSRQLSLSYRIFGVFFRTTQRTKTLKNLHWYLVVVVLKCLTLFELLRADEAMWIRTSRLPGRKPDST